VTSTSREGVSPPLESAEPTQRNLRPLAPRLDQIPGCRRVTVPNQVIALQVP
jgi:hypothetical protein